MSLNNQNVSELKKSHQTVIKIKSLNKSLPFHKKDIPILSDINLEINTGESLAIIGSSGSGKSTLLGLLAGLDKPTSGDVYLAGQMINNLNEDQRAKIRAEHVGFIFQSFQLLENLTAVENVMLPLEILQLQNNSPYTDIYVKSVHMLERVGLNHRISYYPEQLSGGEQQRVAIARAFASNPTILFADEPTGNLDEKTGQNIINLLFEVNHEYKTTLILVTHDIKLALKCDRIFELTNKTLSEKKAGDL